MNQFEIWYAKVRFEDSHEVKERPVLIWNDVAYMITGYKMTGTDRGDNEREFRVEFWREAGLSKPTTIRIGKMLQLKKTDFTRQIGVLDIRECHLGGLGIIWMFVVFGEHLHAFCLCLGIADDDPVLHHPVCSLVVMPSDRLPHHVWKTAFPAHFDDTYAL